MANPKLSKYNFSLFPSFEDFPDIPQEEIVEPKSFRNTLIRTLLWMTLIPAFALFFLLHHQIQSATKDADNVQLSIAQNISSSASNFVFNAVKMVRFSSDLMALDNHSALLKSMLDSLSEQQPELVYSAWLNNRLEILAERVTSGANHVPQELDLQHLPTIARDEIHISKISRDLRHVTITLQTPTADGHSLFFVGVMRLSPLIDLMKDTTQEQRFSVALLEGKNRIIFDSMTSPNPEVVALNDAEWQQIRSMPNGVVIRSAGTRDIAQVRSFVYLPKFDWTFVVSEPLQQRDELIRSSTVTAMYVLLITFAASVLAGFFIAGPMTRSVNELTDAVRRFGRCGKFDGSLVSALEKEGTTELVALGKSFEHMAHDIQDSNAKLAKLNAKLEEQVLERTATVLLRNQELRALHRLLVPIESSNDKTQSDLVNQSLDEFRSLLGLSELRFVANDSTENPIEDSLEIQLRVSVSMNAHQFGWLVVGETDLITADRLESLKRLANSLSILFANKKLVKQLEKEHGAPVRR